MDMNENMNKTVLGFLNGQDTDHLGRRIQEYHDFSIIDMELKHDFIQWIFPTSERSSFNPYAPVLQPNFDQMFQADEDAKHNYCVMCNKYLTHCGMECEGANCVGCDIHDHHKFKIRFYSMPSHNLLRITRMLKSLREVGNVECSEKVYKHLLQIISTYNPKIPSDTLRYWKATQNEKHSLPKAH